MGPNVFARAFHGPRSLKRKRLLGDFGFCCSEHVSMEMLFNKRGWSKHIKIKLIIGQRHICRNKLEFYPKKRVLEVPFGLFVFVWLATRMPTGKGRGRRITPFEKICPSATGRCESPPTRVWRSSLAWRRSWVEDVEGCFWRIISGQG